MTIIKYHESEWPELPEGEPILTKIVDTSFVTEKNRWFGKETGNYNKKGEPVVDNRETVDKVKVIFECVGGEYDGNRIWGTYTASLHEKSNFRKLVDALGMRADEELDTDHMVGKRVLVIGSYDPNAKGDRKFLRPETYVRYKEKVTERAGIPQGSAGIESVKPIEAFDPTAVPF